MKVEVQSKKGLRTSLSIVIDKKTIQKKLEERLVELQSEVNLKGFRPGKVPPAVIKNQFGKAVYGDIIDKLVFNPFFDLTSIFIFFGWARRDSNA